MSSVHEQIIIEELYFAQQIWYARARPRERKRTQARAQTNYNIKE